MSRGRCEVLGGWKRDNVRDEDNECMCLSIVVKGCRCLNGNKPSLDTKVLARRRRKVQKGTQVLCSLTGLEQPPGCWSCFKEPWGGVGQVPRVQRFVGALLCPWDAPVEMQVLCNCSSPPWELGFEQRRSYRVLMLITLKSGMWNLGMLQALIYSGLISLSGNVGIMLPHGGFEKVSYSMLTVHAKENWRGGEKQ